jgi:hypothetical protein
MALRALSKWKIRIHAIELSRNDAAMQRIRKMKSKAATPLFWAARIILG